ncbi:MAG TPA: hypothetical protein VNK04_16950 [Gemmataceae bacterium]|nr:hypothetical protein [Gemmataceae bacterium]
MNAKLPPLLLLLLAPLPVSAQQHKGSPNLEPALRQRKDIVFFCDFETDDWPAHWGLKAPPATAETVSADAALKFEPLAGKALKVRIPQGQNTGLNLSFFFKKMLGEEPEEIYFRYYVRFGDDWKDMADGGKMPGFAGTYNRAGWGGRQVNGSDGWSARGSYRRPRDGRTLLGFYCYHADMRGRYGDIWGWDREGLGQLENNRWYCVEQYIKLNTPGTNGGRGKNDGILRAWIDGRPAFEKTDIRFRDVDTLKVERVWMNVYHGGTTPARSDHHLFIDNVVIARGPIGPLKPPR